MFARILMGALALMTFVATASAADFSPQPTFMQATPAAPAWNWAGFYGGVHLGSGEARTSTDNPVGAFFGTGSIFGDKIIAPGGLGGLQIGANWQLPNSNWVVGLESELSLIDSRGTNTCLSADAVFVGSSCGVRAHSTGSIAARFGTTLGDDNRTLVYGKAGLGYLSETVNQVPNNTSDGIYPIATPSQAFRSMSERAFVIGGGLEYALTSAFSVKLEYEHYGLAAFSQPTVFSTAAGPITMRNSPGFDSVKLGVNYHFGVNDPAPWDALPQASSASQTMEVEVGARAWYSAGKFQKDLASGSSNPASLNSRLTYQDKASSGEIFGKVDWQNVYLRGSVADGRLNTSKLNDEDWLGTIEGPTIPYSNTLSSGKGSPSSGILDVGYNFIDAGRSKLGASIGYTFLYEQHQAASCVQQTPLPYICGPGAVAPGTPIITETDYWNGLRLGLSGQMQLTDRLRLDADVAYLPYVVFSGTDNHWLRDLVIKETGHGQGTQLQAVLSYDVTQDFSIGLGGRYWAMWVDKGSNTDNGFSSIQNLTYKTERVGAFLQGSYKFSVQ